MSHLAAHPIEKATNVFIVGGRKCSEPVVVVVV
jgi:hypothetical protein